MRIVPAIATSCVYLQILFVKTGTGSQEEWVVVDFLFLGSFR